MNIELNVDTTFCNKKKRTFELPWLSPIGLVFIKIDTGAKINVESYNEKTEMFYCQASADGVTLTFPLSGKLLKKYFKPLKMSPKKIREIKNERN